MSRLSVCEREPAGRTWASLSTLSLKPSISSLMVTAAWADKEYDARQLIAAGALPVQQRRCDGAAALALRRIAYTMPSPPSSISTLLGSGTAEICKAPVWAK